jgi:hypothetical protein
MVFSLYETLICFIFQTHTQKTQRAYKNLLSEDVLKIPNPEKASVCYWVSNSEMCWKMSFLYEVRGVGGFCE